MKIRACLVFFIYINLLVIIIFNTWESFSLVHQCLFYVFGIAAFELKLNDW